MRQEVFPFIISGSLPQDSAVIKSVLNDGVSIAAPLTRNTPEAIPVYVSEDYFVHSKMSTDSFNAFFMGVGNDLARLYAAANYNDLKIHALEKLGYDTLSSVSGILDKLEDSISATLDLQFGYNQGFTVYQRTNFINDSSIETDSSIANGQPISYDSRSKQITLKSYSNRDVLHSDQGNILVDVSIDEQIGVPLTSYAQTRTPEHAIDNSSQSFWEEVVLSESPIQINWPTISSVYLPAATAGFVSYCSQGAISEYTISFQNPESFNTIVIKPFSGLPVNIAGIFVVKRTTAATDSNEFKLDTVSQNYSRYAVNEFNSQRQNGLLLLQQTETLSLPNQEDVVSLTIVFHQPHYTKEIFSVPASVASKNNLWQQMLGNALDTVNLSLTGTNTSDIVNALHAALGANIQHPEIVNTDSVQNYMRFQYIYGAYNIEVYDRKYVNSGEFVSTSFNSGINLAQGALVADDKLPMEKAIIAPLNTWFGPAALRPQIYMVPSSTLTYDLSYGNSATWYPVAPLDAATVYEPLIITSPASQVHLRLQAKPSTPVYISSYDGEGNVTLLGALSSPAVTDNSPTIITLPSIQLSAPGFYVVEYTPIDTSKAVDFGYFLGPEPASFQKTWTTTPDSSQTYVATRMHGLTLPESPYIAVEKIGTGFEPNGNPSTDYVPISVSIDGYPNTFVDPISLNTQVISSYRQDTSNLTDLKLSLPVISEVLNSSDNNAAAAQKFVTHYSNWDISGDHFPQLYQLTTAGPPVSIPQIDSGGLAVWEFDPIIGSIHFVNGNAATSGQIAITYWYYTSSYARPAIINRTDYVGQSQPALVAFDPVSYPLIEYVQVGNVLYFNLDIPWNATVTVNYQRLYDNMRLRANFTRVDPSNESATPKLSAFTLLGRDANGTSQPIIDNPEVTWSDIQYYPLGTNIQVNPLRNLVNIVQGSFNAGLPVSPAASLIVSQIPAGLILPDTTELHWYKIVNCGSQTDHLRAQYYSGAGTTVYVDLSGAQYIQPDAGTSNYLNYLIMASDGSNAISIPPGQSILLAIGNTHRNPGTPNSIDPATIYSAQTSNYLQSQTWLLGAALPVKDLSASEFTIS